MLLRRMLAFELDLLELFWIVDWLWRNAFACCILIEFVGRNFGAVRFLDCPKLAD